MKFEPTDKNDDQDSYGRLIAIAMNKMHTSARDLEKLSGVSRKRIAVIIRAGDATRRELNSIFTSLEIDPLRAYVAINQLGDPTAYFGGLAETVANFTKQFTEQLEKQCETRGDGFEPIRRNLLLGLVNDVTDRLFKHQEITSQSQSTG